MASASYSDRLGRTPSSLACAFLTLILTLTCSITALADTQQVSGDDFRSLIKRGDKLVRLGEYNEAEKLFKRASEINPVHSGAKLKLAFVHIKQRRLRDA